MKYTTYYVKQLENRKGKPWQARAKYKDVYGKWKEVSKMLPEAKGKKEAMRIAKEWLDQLNAEADLMPSANHADTVEKVLEDDEYLTENYNRVIEYLEKGFNFLFNSKLFPFDTNESIFDGGRFF